MYWNEICLLVYPNSVAGRKLRFALGAGCVSTAEALRLAHRGAAGKAAVVVVVVDRDVLEGFGRGVGRHRRRVGFALGLVAARALRHALRARRGGAGRRREEVAAHLALVLDSPRWIGKFFGARGRG